MAASERRDQIQRRVVTYEVEVVYPTDLLVRWIVAKWRARRA